MAIQPTQILHAALLVSDLSRAEAFYGGLLGLTKIERSLKFPGLWYQLGDSQLHLIASDALPTGANHTKWGRRPHLALAIANLDAAVAQLTAAQYPLQMSASGRRALFVQDPDGNVIELTEQR